MSRRVIFTRAASIKPEHVCWLWRGRLPLNGISLVAGEPGLGKSTFTVEIAARVTRGQLDGGLFGRVREVLIATAEDHFASVVWGRLRAAGADLERVHRVSVEGGDDLLTLPRDVAAIEARCAEAAQADAPVALVIVDPLGAFIDANTNTHQDSAVRRILSPLAVLAERQALAVLGVTHLRKGDAERLLNRVSGSVAFGAAPRAVLAFARDPGDPEGERGQRRVIVAAKGNWSEIAPTCTAHIEAVEVPEVGSVSHIVFDGDSDLRAEDLRPGADESADDVDEVIGVVLAAGPRLSADVKGAVAQRLGCSTRTVERGASRMRERGELTIEARKFPRRTIWTLVQPPDEDDPASHDRPLCVGVSSLDDTAPQSQIELLSDPSGASGDSGVMTAGSNGHGDPGFIPFEQQERGR